MRRYDLKNTNGDIVWQKTAPEVEELFSLAMIDRETMCRITGLKEWHELNEFFPMLKYGYVLPASSRSSCKDLASCAAQAPRGTTSAIKAGWICCGIGLASAWIFPPAHFFFSVAVVVAIVAMCTHEVKRGLILLCTGLFGAGVSAAVFFSLALGAVATAVAPAVAQAEQNRKALQSQMARNLQAVKSTANALNASPSAQPSFPATRRQKPLEEYTASELVGEIARLEELHRASRKANRPVPTGIAEKLLQAQAAYDTVTAANR